MIEMINLKNVTEEMLETSMPINLENKKVVIFGAGNAGKEFIELFPHKCEYIIDNDSTKWGTTMAGLPIYGIQKIENEKKDELFVIVTSMYYEEISGQLRDIYLKENINFTNGNQFLIEISKNYYTNLHKDAPTMKKISLDELNNIQKELNHIGIQVQDYCINIRKFGEFKTKYMEVCQGYSNHGESIQDEKILEHFIAYERMDVEGYSKNDIYIDVAAGHNVWAKLLREKNKIQSFAIDLNIAESLKEYNYYLEQDATNTNFEDESVSGMSLQCAFEMFMYDDDKNLILEASRILKKGGKLVISPLYLNTHYCSSCSPEYYNRGLSDPEAIEYLRINSWGIPSSRHYDSKNLFSRILKTIEECGMQYKIYRIRNLDDINEGLYLNFLLEITKCDYRGE